MKFWIILIIILIVSALVFEVAIEYKNAEYAKKNCKKFCEDQNKVLVQVNGRYCMCKYEFLENYLNES